jgi:hypothetical protein
MKIQDGTGKGYEAEIDSTNRLKTRAVIEDEWVEALSKGDHYAITSSPITLTAATASAMMWFRNDNDEDLLIDRVILNSADSTGGTVDVLVLQPVVNPTAMASGSGNDVTQVNTNLGSSKELTLTSEKGLEGASLTGGSVAAAWNIENPTNHRVLDVRFLVPKGSSIGFNIIPPASNTSMVVSVSVNAHKVVEI